MRFIFWLILLCLSFTLLACQSLPTNPTTRNVERASNSFASGTSLQGQLNRTDIRALNQVFLSAMDNEQANTSTWQGTNAEGSITPGRYFIANLLADPDLMTVARPGLDIAFDMETEQGDFVLTKNSNVRQGPSTNHTIVETLPSGTAVKGLGKIINQDWMLISVDNRVRGYVFIPLMIKAPGTDSFSLAGTPIRRPYLCREFTQSITVGGQKDRWQGLACDEGEGWALANRGGPSILGNGS